jgi:hypothetical protein
MSAGAFNECFDEGQPFAFDFSFFDADYKPIVVTSWLFSLTLKNSLGSDIWVLGNGDFLRPSVERIYHNKTEAEVTALPPGEYTLSLRVTNTEWVDDEIIKGILVR